MGRKGRSVALVLAGLGLVALSVLADAVGIGNGDYVFGWEQMLGVAVGMTVVWYAAMRLAGWGPAARRREPSHDAKHVTPVSV
jgi:hypothetical protein